jgi:prenylcysteine alpha-carboxyl methylesterase
MWGSLLARALTAAGIVVVIPDMRNYPLAAVPEMVQDVYISLEWTFQHIAEYGGDPTKLVVVGQSAGGHLSFMAMLKKLQSFQRFQDHNRPSDHDDACDRGMAERLFPPTSDDTSWVPSDLKGIVSISAPFHLQAMVDSFQKKGLDNQLVNRIFDFQNDKYDPFIVLKEFQDFQDGVQLLVEELPPIRIYHGTADRTVPHESSETFYRELKRSIVDGQKLDFVSYPGWSHTDPILEGPMDADQSLHRDLFNNVREWTGSHTATLSWPSDDPVIKNRLCPHVMVQAGRFFNPF